MKIADHLEKVRRLSEFRSRADRIDDFELRVWASIAGSMNAFNAALHVASLTKELDAYPYNAVGLYVIPPRTKGGWRKDACALGDLIHIGMPTTPFSLPLPLSVAAKHIQQLESFPPTTIRTNSREICLEDADRCDELFESGMRSIAAFFEKISGQRML